MSGTPLAPSSLIRVYSRSEWGARAPKPGMIDQPHVADEAFLHHSDDTDAATLDHLHEQCAKMRQIQDYHMLHNGWSDIAYHWVVMQPFGSLRHARVFEGRSWRKVPAAQLNHNAGTLAICTVGNFDNERLKVSTRRAIVAILRHHQSAKFVRCVGGHRDVVATDCPGTNLYRNVGLIAEKAGLKTYKEMHG